MSEMWIQQNEEILKTLQKLKTKKDKDRLDIINSIIYTLTIIDRSILGWRNWIQNLGFMTRFSVQELEKIEEGLLKQTQTFIEYDNEVTKTHLDKIPRIKFEAKTKRPKAEGNVRGIYT